MSAEGHFLRKLMVIFVKIFKKFSYKRIFYIKIHKFTIPFFFSGTICHCIIIKGISIIIPN